MFRVLQSLVGNDFSHKPGDIVGWDDQEDAERMVAAGILERIVPKPLETATRKTKETR